MFAFKRAVSSAPCEAIFVTCNWLPQRCRCERADEIEVASTGSRREVRQEDILEGRFLLCLFAFPRLLNTCLHKGRQASTASEQSRVQPHRARSWARIPERSTPVGYWRRSFAFGDVRAFVSRSIGHR